MATDRAPRYVGATLGVGCPQCGGSVQRIRRRWIDRLTSLVRRVRRYRCLSPVCGWEGNLSERR